MELVLRFICMADCCLNNENKWQSDVRHFGKLTIIIIRHSVINFGQNQTIKSDTKSNQLLLISSHSLVYRCVNYKQIEISNIKSWSRHMQDCNFRIQVSSACCYCVNTIHSDYACKWQQIIAACVNEMCNGTWDPNKDIMRPTNYIEKNRAKKKLCRDIKKMKIENKTTECNAMDDKKRWK